jgi:hypothetical protein
MGTSNEPRRCPSCGGPVVWDGRDQVCISCPWTELRHQLQLDKRSTSRRSRKKKSPVEKFVTRLERCIAHFEILLKRSKVLLRKVERIQLRTADLKM